MTARALRWLAEERDAYLLGLLRAGMGVLLLLQSARALLELSQAGFFGDYFHLPILPEALVPSRSAYHGLLWLELAAAALAIAGVWGRAALLAGSSIGLYLLLCDRLQYHNNRYALLLIAFLTSLTPCDRSWSVLRLGARGASTYPKGCSLAPAERRAPSWARRLVQLQVSLVYAASALGKLADPDWRSGHVLGVRYVNTLHFLRMQGIGVPYAIAHVYASEWFASATAKGAIALELFLAIGLWLPRTRAFALWLGVLFHLGIELSARVELFSWLMCTAYLAFVTPECRERVIRYDPRPPVVSRLVWLLHKLDFLARFELRAVPAPDPRGPVLRVTDRAGTTHTGVAALAQLARAFPPLFLLWPPLAAAALLTRRRALQASTGSSQKPQEL